MQNITKNLFKDKIVRNKNNHKINEYSYVCIFNSLKNIISKSSEITENKL